MSKSVITLLALAALVPGLTSVASATPPLSTLQWDLKPIAYEKGVELTEVELTLRCSRDCDDVEVNFVPDGRLTIVDEATITGSMKKGEVFTRRLHLLLPDNDTTSIGINIRLDSSGFGATKYFITTGETIIASNEIPSSEPEPVPCVRSWRKPSTRWHLEPVNYVKGQEVTVLEFFYYHRYACGQLDVSFTPIGGLSILGESSFSGPFTKDNPFTARLQVMLPDNDTCGVEFLLDLCGLVGTLHKYFITTGETVVTSSRDPALGPIGAGMHRILHLPDIPQPPRPSTDSIHGRPAPTAYWHLEPVDYVKGQEVTELEFFYHDEFACGQLEVSFTPIGGLSILGESSFSGPFTKDSPFAARMQVMLPDNDTCGVEFLLDLCGLVGTLDKYFITTGETVVTSNRDPALGPRRKPSGSFIELPDIPQPPRPAGDSGGHVRRYTLPDSLQEILYLQSVQEYRAHKDSVNREVILELEMTPLTDSAEEWIMIGDEGWGRLKGEQKFQPWRYVGDYYETEMQNKLTRIFEHSSPDRELELVLDLREPDDLEYLRSRGMDIHPTDTVGFYRCKVTRHNMQYIFQRRIPWRRDAPRPAQLPSRSKNAPMRPSGMQDFELRPDGDQPDDRPTSRGERIGANPGEKYDVVFQEGFEDQYWDDIWYLADEWVWCGDDYWDISTYLPPFGDRSVWCNGYGDMSDPGPYDCFSNAILNTPFGINTIGYINLQFIFWIRHDLPLGGFDAFFSGVSPNGVFDSPFLTVWQIEGTSVGWYEKVYDLGVWDKVYLWFNFFSGSTVCGHTGVYIDNVALIGDALPDLRPYTPTGWDAPLIVSPETGAQNWGTMYGGEPMYISWAIFNHGPGDAGPFEVGVYDTIGQDVLIHSWPVSSLGVGEPFDVTDWQGVVLSSGEHALALSVDHVGDPPVHQVHEWLEWNNNWSSDPVEWLVPELTVSGTIEYTDPNLGTTIPARGVNVIIWDEDGSTDDSMGTAVTDDYGYFELGPIVNNDETDMRDIYLHIVAENEAAHVHEAYNLLSYRTYTDTIYDIPCPTRDFGTIVHDSSYSEAFYIADKLLDGYRQWLSWRPGNDPGDVKVVLNDTIPTCWDGQHSILWITDSLYGSYPDVFDGDIILHEYCHFIADTFDFLELGGGTHQWHVPMSASMAAGEGFATFFSCAVRQDPLMQDFHNKLTYTEFWNSENGQWGKNSTPDGSVNDSGLNFEGANAGVFWDIFDYADDDFNSNGFGDTISLGMTQILEALVDGNCNSNHPDSLLDFWCSWMDDRQLGHFWGMHTVYREHGILMPCCDGTVGNVQLVGACDPSEQDVDIKDLTSLVDHLFINYPELCCPEEADIDPAIYGGTPDGQVDISDLNAMIDHLFGTYPPMPECPCVERSKVVIRRFQVPCGT